MSGANLHGADLREADLFRANLSGADLRGANLYGADLSEGDLSGANLLEAYMYRAGLPGANLSRANLREANLSRADLSGAELYEANLFRANLYGANLRGAKNAPDIPMACPDTGSFIGWKKCGDLIVKLQIPEDAKRCSATGRSCRCDRAIVLEIQNANGSKADADTARSNYDEEFIYKIGETVEPEQPFDEDRWNECASGIHFFINRQEAVEFS